MPLHRLLPHVSVERRDHAPRHVELHLRWGRLWAWFTKDERGVSVNAVEKYTNRFFEWFLDTPTGEITCRFIYKKER